MAKQDFYFVRVDEHNKWTPCKYRKVSCEELNNIIDTYGKTILSLCSNGNQGSMTMWAYFKSHICGGCYNDMINAYRLLSDDSKSLVDREHEFRHALNQYKELWQIRYFGSVENYHLEKSKEAKKQFEKYKNL